MSNFAFLQLEWPTLHDAATKAEALAYPDARTACFHARRGLEQGVECQGLGIRRRDSLAAGGEQRLARALEFRRGGRIDLLDAREVHVLLARGRARLRGDPWRP